MDQNEQTTGCLMIVCSERTPINYYTWHKILSNCDYTVYF